MCGFAGFTNVDRSSNRYVEDVHRMLRAIAHRGRDEMGYFVDDTTALAAVRLAIIDTPMGKQPMSTPDGRYWLAFNGEVFNYLEIRSQLQANGVAFRTDSDTEVLCLALATWGAGALSKLNGQFGFAFHDRLTGRVLLARDRFGERPVFYSRHGEGLLFASEVKGIFALPYVRRALSSEGLRQTYRCFSPLPGMTPFEDVWSLPPGHQAVFENGRLEVSPYYTFPSLEPTAVTDPGEAAEAIRSALAESVRLRLRSDYEIGAFISGGIDSAVIASLARPARPERFRTFSAVMDDPRIDESSHQQVVVDALGTDHTAVTITGTDVRQLFPVVVNRAEAPLFRTAAIVCFRLAEVTHEAGMRVVLSGEGSDELFLGYDIFKEAWLLQNFDGFADDADRAGWLDMAFNDARTTKAIDARAVIEEYGRLRSVAGGSMAPHLRRFGDEGSGAGFLAEPPPQRRWEDDLDQAMRAFDPMFGVRTHIEKAQLLDIATLLSGYGLSYQWDKAGMHHQVETRFPFLDTAVVDVAWSIAVSLRLGDGHREKEILKQAVAALVPRAVVERPKRALRAPGAEHLRRNGSDDWVAATVSGERLARSSVVDAVRARRLIEVAHAGDGSIPYPANHGYALLLSTLLVEEHFVDAFELPWADVEGQLARRVDLRSAAQVV